jgi:hypothetical protein
MSGCLVTIAGGFPPRSGQELARYVTKLTEAERTVAERESGVKHARMAGTAACCAALAGRVLLDRIGARKTGIICTGGPWALAAINAFIDRAKDAGPGLVNPQQFPATLLSATATAPAGLLKAHAFAYVIGHDRLAFFEALRRATVAVEYGLAERVLVLAVSGGDAPIELARERAGLGRHSLDTAIAFGIGAGTSQATLELLGVYIDSPAPAHSGEWYEAEWRGNAFSCQIDTPLADGEAYGASGAVLCLAAARHHAALAADPTGAFAVAARADGRSATAIFRSIRSAAAEESGMPPTSAQDVN